MTPPQARLAQALGAILRSQRAWHMLTQADLAAATGISRTRVGGFERGRLVYDVWEATQLARALQMPLAELLQPCLALGHPGAGKEENSDGAAGWRPSGRCDRAV